MEEEPNDFADYIYFADIIDEFVGEKIGFYSLILITSQSKSYTLKKIKVTWLEKNWDKLVWGNNWFIKGLIRYEY